METCYEYLGCAQHDCVMYGRTDDKFCWEVEGTLCNHHGIELMREKFGEDKEMACARSGCIYYEATRISV